MDLRKYQAKLTEEELATLKVLYQYQPAVLNDDCVTGAALTWGGLARHVVERSEVDKATWEKAVDLNSRMRKMYDDFLDIICETVGDIKGLSVLDIGCSGGYYLYGLKDRGAGRCVGYDKRPSLDPSFYSLMNRITGHDIEFNYVAYDQMAHQIPDAEPADIVIASSIMCHFSDPHYFMAYAGKMAKKALFLFTTVDETPGYRITFEDYHRYQSNPFPACFDYLNLVSLDMINLGFKELGFTKVVDIPHRPEWLSERWYKQYHALVGVR